MLKIHVVDLKWDLNCEPAVKAIRKPGLLVLKHA